MNDQDVFDRVATHLLTQKRRSTNQSIPLYRDDRGNKCAIGCLIDDEHYNPILEGSSILRN